MAEGWLRHLAGERLEVFSAGLEPREIHPLAVTVMRDAGIDISGQRSKSVSEFLGRRNIPTVVFVCASAEKNCPTIYPFAFERLTWPFEDPAEFAGSEEEKVVKFREVRDQIERRIREWLQTGAKAGEK
jgi:arsenate reductase